MRNIDQTLQNIVREEEENRTKQKAALFQLPYINLVSYPIAPDLLLGFRKEDILSYHIVPYLRMDKKVRLATPHPELASNSEYLSWIQQNLGLEPILSVCSESSFDYALSLYDQSARQATSTEVEVSEQKKEDFEQEIRNLIDLKEKITKVSTTQLLDVVFAGAVKTGASDIHIEPGEKEFILRYRIDGILHDIAVLPIQAFHALESRIKFLAGLKMDVNRQPQDGRFDFKAAGTAIDIRVSLMPSTYGAAIVMRLLSQEGNFLNLDQLGFSEESKTSILGAINKPHGMILNTGPTGSGKTTTLYALLSILNKPDVKIITLEDPIEYRLEGVEQIQIDAEQKMDFATALRGVLRQDPDIIMVGEIRDRETTEIAIQAAMTGHLVLSTLHTNNAPEALARLIDMGVQPFLLAGSVNAIIAQRLVRRICSSCHGQGCEACNNTGFKNRVVIAEVLVPNEKIDKLIMEKAPVRTFLETAKEIGMTTMLEDGMKKVEQGITTKEEILRVTTE